MWFQNWTSEVKYFIFHPIMPIIILEMLGGELDVQEQMFYAYSCDHINMNLDMNLTDTLRQSCNMLTHKSLAG